MKYIIKFTNAFKKSRKRMQKRGYDLTLLDGVIARIASGQKLEEKWKDHELSGLFRGFHECHIKPDWLLIYLLEEECLVLVCVDTGSHSDLF